MGNTLRLFHNILKVPRSNFRWYLSARCCSGADCRGYCLLHLHQAEETLATEGWGFNLPSLWITHSYLSWCVLFDMMCGCKKKMEELSRVVCLFSCAAEEEELRLAWTNDQQQQSHPKYEHPHLHQHPQQQPAGHTGPRQQRSRERRDQQRPRAPDHDNANAQPGPRRPAQVCVCVGGGGSSALTWKVNVASDLTLCFFSLPPFRPRDHPVRLTKSSRLLFLSPGRTLSRYKECDSEWVLELWKCKCTCFSYFSSLGDLFLLLLSYVDVLDEFLRHEQFILIG